MPITIIAPAPDAPFGWGQQFNIITDLSHNEVGDGHWEISVLTGPTFETQWHTWAYPFSGSSVVQLLGQRPDLKWDIPIPVEGLLQGKPGKLRVELFSDTGVSLQQQVQPTVNDQVSGQAYITTTSTTTVEGGFTATDRAQLQAVSDATQGSLNSGCQVGQQFLMTIFDLADRVPSHFLTPVEPRQLSGSGTLTRTGGPTGVNAFGARWDFVTVPPELGVQLGALPEYRERIAQFIVWKRDGGNNLFADSVQDVHDDHQQFRWSTAGVDHIDYAILPGVTIQWSWLVVCQAVGP